MLFSNQGNPVDTGNKDRPRVGTSPDLDLPVVIDALELVEGCTNASCDIVKSMHASLIGGTKRLKIKDIQVAE